MGGKLGKKGIRATEETTEDHKDEGETSKPQPAAGSTELENDKDSQAEGQESKEDPTESQESEASAGTKSEVQQHTEEELVASGFCSEADLPHPQEVTLAKVEESRDEDQVEEMSTSKAQGIQCGGTPASDKIC